MLVTVDGKAYICRPSNVPGNNQRVVFGVRNGDRGTLDSHSAIGFGRLFATPGEVLEWLNRTVSKTVVVARLP